MRLLTLGGLALEGGALAGPGLLLLLAYLALEGPQARSLLAERFWPGSDRGRKNLTMAVARLQKVSPGLVEVGESHIAAHLATDFAEVFERLSHGDVERALTLYRGPFLEGFRSQVGVELEEWIYERRERLAAHLRQALVAKAEQTLLHGEFAAAASYAEKAYLLAGAPALEPSEIAHLHALIFAGGSPYAHDLAAEANEFGLPVPSTPEAAKRELQRALAVPTNLSVPEASLIGRERELADLASLIAGRRLLTLIGPAGVGKTRLALEAARREHENGRFRDGVFFVELASLQNPELLVSSIAQALGVAESTTQHGLEHLKVSLCDKRLLLVLDNFEHIVAAAPVVAGLSRASPSLVVMVTSRTPLQLSGEQEFQVPPLELPDVTTPPSAAQLLRYPAVELFVRRARGVEREFMLTDENAEAVAEICVRLDGLPLALELAGARIKLFAPHALLGRLNSRLTLLKGGAQDKPLRHQSLEGAIAWSYELLSEEEQIFFRRCSVFVGGFTLNAAERVCGHGLELNTLDAVAILVNGSLLRPLHDVAAEPRFIMLETIREYGLAHLRRSGELPNLAQRHAESFLTLAEKAEGELTGLQQGVWLERLEADHPNLRAALTWAQATGREDLALRLGAAFWRFWVMRGYLREGRERLEALLKGRVTGPSTARAKALNGLGTLIFELGDFAGADTAFQEALSIWQELNAPLQTATVLNNLGWITLQRGDLSRGKQLSEEALSLSRQLNNERSEAVSLTNLGSIAVYQGKFKQASNFFGHCLSLQRHLENQRGTAYALANLSWPERYLGSYEAAQVLLEESLFILRALKDKQLTAWTLWQSGNLAFDLLDLDRARLLLDESLALHREVENGEGIADALMTLAEVSRTQGDLTHAATLLSEALTIWQEVPFAWGLASTLYSQGCLALENGAGELALSCLRESFRLREKLNDTYGIAECLETLARADFDPYHAICLTAAAHGLRERTGAVLPPRRRVAYERWVANARHKLGEDGFLRAWSEGQFLSRDRANIHQEISDGKMT